VRLARLRAKFNACIEEAHALSRRSFADGGLDPDEFPLSALLAEGRQHVQAWSDAEWERVVDWLRASSSRIN
jgi:hypothetical protein